MVDNQNCSTVSDISANFIFFHTVEQVNKKNLKKGKLLHLLFLPFIS